MWTSIIGSVLDLIGPPLLKAGLSWFETKVPNSASVINTLLSWLGQAQASGNTAAVSQLSEHLQKLYTPTSGVAEPSTLK